MSEKTLERESLVMSRGNNFYGQVMTWVAAAFGMTAIGIFFIGPLVPQSLMMPLYIVTLVVLIGSSFLRKVRGLSGILTLVVPTLIGIMLYPTLNYYVATGAGDLIFISAIGTAITFGGAAIVGWTSKKSLNKFAGPLFGITLAIIGLSLLNAFFFHLPILQFLISIGILIIFTVYSYIDVQAIRDRSMGNAPASQYALHVFIDIINIFISLLNILGFLRR